MCETVWCNVKSKMNQFGRWIKANWSSVLFVVFSVVLILFIMIASIFYALIASITKDTMLKSLIEAEATILGFFGIIVVYALTSFDTRLDRLIQQKFESQRLDYTKTVSNLNTRIIEISNRKRKTMRSILIDGSFLILSLFLSILALGIPDALLSFSLLWFSLYFLFEGIALLLVIFYDLGETEEATKQDIG